VISEVQHLTSAFCNLRRLKEDLTDIFRGSRIALGF
jgi:hypothetical protein